MLCNKKHITNPIPDEDWKCPKCGEGSNHFALWDFEGDCELDHPDDYASCTNCDYGVSLGTMVKKYWKEKGIEWITCPCCKGKGLVDKKTLEDKNA